MSVRALIAAAGLLAALSACQGGAQQAPPTTPATENTNAGPLVIHALTHGSVLFGFKGRNYYVDPSGNYAYVSAPKADAILITHEHGDHANPQVVAQIRKADTILITNEATARRFPGAQVMNNGDTRRVLDITVEAVPAYNLVRRDDAGRFFHPKGRDNGYVLTFGNKRVYVAGDTEATPEMKALKGMDIAFLPINLPFTMPPEEAAGAARAFRPRILYPYHQGDSDPGKVRELLRDVQEIEVRVLRLP